MDDIEKFLSAEANDKRPLIISGCFHGVTESWGFKEYLLKNIRGAERFNIIARGVQPDGQPKIDGPSQRIIGVELTVEEIARSVILLIHHTKFGHYRNRFGSDVLERMKKEGYLEVREDPRFWNLRRIADEKKQNMKKYYPDYTNIQD